MMGNGLLFLFVAVLPPFSRYNGRDALCKVLVTMNEGVPGQAKAHEKEMTRARMMDYRNRENGLLIEKAIGLTGICSYKAAFEMLKMGRIKVDGNVARAGQIVSIHQEMCLDDVPLPSITKPVYYVLNKPRGVLSTRPGSNAKEGEKRKAAAGGCAQDFVPPVPPVVAAGRLDFESEGLLVLTNDGSLIHAITSPVYSIQKTYHVLVRSMRHGAPVETTTPANRSTACALTDALARLERDGAVLKSGKRLVCRSARLLGTSDSKNMDAHESEACSNRGLALVEMILEEGRNREVRKMMASAGYHVLSLVRTCIGGIEGPCSQQQDLLALMHSDCTDRMQMNLGDEIYDVQLMQDKKPLQHLRLPQEIDEACVVRGSVLQPGQWCMLDDDEVTKIFQQARISNA